MNQQQVKQHIKQVLSLIAPKAASTWQNVRQRRHIQHFEQRMGLPELSSHAKESWYLVPTCARIAVTLWQSVSKFW